MIYAGRELYWTYSVVELAKELQIQQIGPIGLSSPSAPGFAPDFDYVVPTSYHRQMSPTDLAIRYLAAAASLL